MIDIHLFSVIVCISIIVGDVAEFRLKNTMHQILKKNRGVSLLLVYLFVFFVVISGDLDTFETLQSNLKTSLVTFAVLMGLNFLGPMPLLVVLCQLVGDYYLNAKMNSAILKNDHKEAHAYKTLLYANIVVTALIILQAIGATLYAEGIEGVINTVLPLGKDELTK